MLHLKHVKVVPLKVRQAAEPVLISIATFFKIFDLVFVDRARKASFFFTPSLYFFYRSVTTAH